MDLQIVSTVLVPATSAFTGGKPYDLVGLPLIKAELDIDNTGTDALIFSWITEASAAAAKFCNRVFPIETVQDQIYPPRDYFPAPTVIGGVKALQLSRWPIAAKPSTAGIAPPLPPALSAVAGGSVPGTFYARITYVTARGETAASIETSLSVAAGLLQVASPAADPGGIASGWNCYLGSTSFGETLQNVTPLAIGTPFTLPGTGLTTTGAATPSYVLAIENGNPLGEGLDFLVSADVGQLIRLDTNGWPRRWPALPTIVQYPAGYDLKNDPNVTDLSGAVIRMVKDRWFARKRDSRLRSENIAGAYEAQYWFASGPGAAVGNMTPDVSAMLERYRVPVTG